MTSGPPQPADDALPPTTQLAPDPGAAYPGGPPAAGPTGGVGFGVVAVILGVVGCVFPLVPIDLTGVRGYLAFGLGLPGLIVGIIGCTGRRRGRALAIVGVVLSAIALVFAAIMLLRPPSNQPSDTGPGDHTQQVLRDDLDVQLSALHGGATADTQSVTVTLRNKGSDVATFGVTVKQTDNNSGNSCQSIVSVNNLSPGASYQTEVRTCQSDMPLSDSSLQVTQVTKSID